MSQYPYESGDVLVLGPGCFADKNEEVICWRGRNYYWIDDDDDYNDYPPLT